MENKGFQKPITHYKINSISPVYTYACAYFIPDPDVIKKYEPHYGNIEKYRVLFPIGSGKYSVVFLGHRKKGYCAIKFLKNVPFEKVQREIYILDRIKYVSNVLQVYDIIKDPMTNALAIITNFVNTSVPKDLYPTLSLEDIRYYMYVLLNTLDRVHSLGVMHRDVKPGNFLIDHSQNQALLVDWGLSDLYYPRKQYTIRVSTMRYKAPELLLSYHFYDYGVDIWGAGCIMAEMLIRQQFFTGSTYAEVLMSICNLWGSVEIRNYIDKYGIDVPADVASGIPEGNTISTWPLVVQEIRPNYKDADAIDLLKKMLTIDHGERITARDALKHPFFARL